MRRFAVEYEFGARDAMPAKVRYKRKNKEGDESKRRRYAQHPRWAAWWSRNIIDHYRAGVQSSRVNYEKVAFNAPVPNRLPDPATPSP